jgi:hypothetical protein
MERKQMYKLTTLARAKLVKNTKLKTLRLIVAFNVYEQNAKGEYKFPVSKKCDYVSGDLQADEVLDAVANAKAQLRTDNIEFVV